MVVKYPIGSGEGLFGDYNFIGRTLVSLEDARREIDGELYRAGIFEAPVETHSERKLRREQNHDNS